MEKIVRSLSTAIFHQSIGKKCKKAKNRERRRIFQIPFGFRTQREMRTLKRDEHKFGSFISQSLPHSIAQRTNFLSVIAVKYSPSFSIFCLPTLFFINLMKDSFKTNQTIFSTFIFLFIAKKLYTFIDNLPSIKNSNFIHGRLDEEFC